MAANIFVRSLAGIVIFFSLFIVFKSFGLIRDDLRFTREQTEVSFWGRKEYRPTTQHLLATQQGIKNLLVSSPDHPDYLELSADAGIWAAYWQGDPVVAMQLAGQAVDDLHRALQSRPAHLQNWAKMVEYAARSETGGPLRELAASRLEAWRSALE